MDDRLPRAARRPGPARLPAVLLTVLVLLVAGGAAPGPSASAAASGVTTDARVDVSARTTSGNPLAGRPWGVYKGAAEMAWPPYERAEGQRKKLLRKIALRPKAKWFGHWIPTRDIKRKVVDYVRGSQAGDRRTLVQLTVFRMVPWEHAACDRLPTRAEAADYRRWIRQLAAGVGTAHAAIVLQPDGPFALCAPGSPADPRSPSRLVAYAAQRLSAKPNTSVYIEVGAADWPAPGQGGVDAVMEFLVHSGIEHARGIALNGTHYSATELEVERGAAVVEALAERGIRGKKVVINTSSNGLPFEFGSYTGKDPLNAQVCRSPRDRRTCVTLGIPPTADVAARRWGLDARTRRLAQQHVDGYLWFGRPWLYRQNEPFVMKRALQLARSTPY